MRFSKIWCEGVGCVHLTSGRLYDTIMNIRGLKGGIMLGLMNDS